MFLFLWMLGGRAGTRTLGGTWRVRGAQAPHFLTARALVIAPQRLLFALRQPARLRPWPAFLWCLHSLLSSQADLSSSRTFLPIKALYLLLLIIPDRFRTDSRAKNSRLALHSRWKPKDGFEQKVLDLLELLQSYPAVSSAVLPKSRSFRC